MVEFEKFGYNWDTAFFIATMLLVGFQLYALIMQNIRIWSKGKRNSFLKEFQKKVRSVNVIWYLSTCGFGYVVLIYGIRTRTCSVISIGIVMGLVSVPILIGLWRYKGFSEKEMLLAKLFLVFVPIFSIAMIVVPTKKGLGELFIFIGVLRVISYGIQPFEILREKSRGDIEIKVPLVTMLGAFVWLGYSYTLNKEQIPGLEWLRIYFFVYIATVGFTFFLCLIFPEKKEAKALKV